MSHRLKEPSDDEALAYMDKALRSKQNESFSPARERLINALPGICFNLSSRIDQLSEQERLQKGWSGAAMRIASGLSLPRLAETLEGLPEGSARAGLEAYLAGLPGFDAERGSDQPESAREGHGRSVMALIRIAGMLEIHLQHCAAAGVDPGPAQSWALTPEESRARVAILAERAGLDEAAGPASARRTGAARV